MTRTMKYPVIALLLAFTTAAGADDVRRTVDAADDGNVTVSNTAGSVVIKGWSRDVVEVVADLGSGVEELQVERDGNEVSIVVKVPRSQTRNRSISSDLVVRVPQGSSIKVGGVSADITVSGIMGAQRLKTVSGDVESEAFEADIDIESVSGDLEVAGDGKDTRSRLATVSGEIDVTGLHGEIEASSVNGDIMIVNGSFERTRLNTTNGDMVFHAALRDRGRLDVETINGDLDIEFVGDVSARFDIETFNGDIRNCFGPEAQRTSRYAPGRELAFTEGGGSGRVSIRTLNGDVGICRD